MIGARIRPRGLIGGLEVAAYGLLVLIVSSMVIACGGCDGRCSVDGCPPDLVCSLATGRCVEPELVYGPPCPLGASQCHGGVCLQLPPEDGGPTCTATCESDDPPCPPGFRCLPVSDGRGGTTQVCVPTGEGKIGDPCESGTDCESHLCLPYEPEPFCSDFCEEDPSICGEGNVACLTFLDVEGNEWDLCVRGGASGPGEGCPHGVVDCDLTRTEICLASEDNRINFCTVGCPDGPEDCLVLPGGCCVDLGESDNPEDFFCLPAEHCPCVPQCLGRNCGPDGCGGLCGVCDEGQVCDGGVCVECIPDCEEAECGPDGCGGECGSCDPGEQCIFGVCSGTCTPLCEGRECGPDGCGGLCGACVTPERCHDGECVDPDLLLVDALVIDPSRSPSPLWGLGEYRGPPSIGPPLEYGQGPQPGTTQVSLCGETVACHEDSTLVEGAGYELRLGFQRDGELIRCFATFSISEQGHGLVSDQGDCVLDGEGPLGGVWVDGSVDALLIGWELP